MVVLNKNFEVVIVHKKVKNINVKVTPRYEIIVTVPLRFSNNEINHLLQNNISLIERLVKKVHFIDLKDEEIIIFGQRYTLCGDMLIEKEYVIMGNKIFYRDINKLYQNCIDIICQHFKHVATKNNFDLTTSLVFKKMKSRWGVCYIQKNKICLTQYLIHVPIHLIEYVICHEFCHFQYPNHSSQFYLEVSKYYKDYSKARSELKKYSYFLK